MAENLVRRTDLWSSADLARLDVARELEIAVRQADGTLRRAVPVWVVCAGSHVYVRTWYRRDTGWFGQALRTHRARIGVEGWEADVAIEDVGLEDRAAVDAAYRVKYGRFGEGSAGDMVNDSAAATTLRLAPVPRA
ncbi:hypothetical protein Amsp01_092100 [Amycolatopsis sp. NBRC 101858]|uniref:DUF2255 family protein n=1 Tax=Amycolatopsis sp. NBRC 101858 TaxID=3032200 RepID=UPI0024A22ABF|nr:DUF2255 family protein [Amycolatopsis sp. NBRC 101858]GLY43187.1 hypothetical protein Amsp01_092100 [Amycolatopsis sp. NBRC 101858]